MEEEKDVKKEEAKQTTEKPRTRRYFVHLWQVGLVFIALLVGAGGMYLYFQYGSHKPESEVEHIQKYLSSVMELPNESPTFATVSDVSQLSGQTFFEHALNGDKVLIYPNSKMAILYRPSTKKIIAVGPVKINTDNTLGASTSAPNDDVRTTPTPTKAMKSVTITVYNGTKKAGLARTAAQTLSQSFPSGKIVNKSDAKESYDKTIVIDVTGANKVEAENLARLVNGTVTTLPKEETAPSADLLVILGDDYK